MSIISVVIGSIFKQLPSSLRSTQPVGEYAAIAMLVFFGLRTLQEAHAMPSRKASLAVEDDPEGLDQAMQASAEDAEERRSEGTALAERDRERERSHARRCRAC